jgi:hypothetical protein
MDHFGGGNAALDALSNLLCRVHFTVAIAHV